MHSDAAARRYASALFTLARETGRIDEIRRELSELAGLLRDSGELRHAILRPLHPGAQRRAALQAVCDRLGSSRELRNFCSLLVDHRRVIAFEAIERAYGVLADRAAGRARAEVVSASSLRPEQRERLRSALAARTGKQVELTERVDPALLGGAVASIGGLVFDGSLRTQLEQLRTTLTRGN